MSRWRAASYGVQGQAFIDSAERASGRIISAILDRAAPGTRSGRLLDRALRVPWHALVSLAVFAFLALETVRALNARDHPEAVAVMLVAALGLLLLRRPVAVGLVIAIGGVLLRLPYVTMPETCDQLVVSRAALTTALGGTNPWGFGYAESVPPGAPYPYGPGALFTAMVGVPGEVVAVAGIMAILAATRSLLTLAILAAYLPAVELGTCGLNDQIPALLIIGGLLLFERHRLTGALLIAISAAIKPYGFAWFPAMAAYGGAGVAAALLGVTLVLWSPLLVWGPDSFVRSVELARGIHPKPENTLNMPALRILAVPLAAVSLLVRSWWLVVLSGISIFVVVLFLDRWASFGYWFVVLPLLGLLLERALRWFGGQLQLAAGDRQGPRTARFAGVGSNPEELLPAGGGSA
jgi:hypothetical protein